MNQRLKEFLVRKIGVSSEKLTPASRLSEDLGCAGLDAVTLFNDFFLEFDIKNIEEFDADLHIDFSVDFVQRPLSRLKNLFNKNRWKYLRPDVTLGHLEKVIESGKWQNER